MKGTLLILFLLFTGYGIGPLVYAQDRMTETKKAVMIIAQDGFRDEEFIQPKEILERHGIEVITASTALTQAEGMLGTKVKPDILVKDIDIKDFSAVIFIGGQGATQYWDDPVAHRLAQEANSSNKIVAAICIAPVTLAKAGILKAKRVTAWPSEAGKLATHGAQYTGRPVEKDGNIITASGPTAAGEFAEELLKALKY